MQQAQLQGETSLTATLIKAGASDNKVTVSKIAGKRTTSEPDGNEEQPKTGRWKKWEHQRFLEGNFHIYLSIGIVRTTLAISGKICRNSHGNTNQKSRAEIFYERE